VQFSDSELGIDIYNNFTNQLKYTTYDNRIKNVSTSPDQRKYRLWLNASEIEYPNFDQDSDCNIEFIIKLLQLIFFYDPTLFLHVTCWRRNLINTQINNNYCTHLFFNFFIKSKWHRVKIDNLQKILNGKYVFVSLFDLSICINYFLSSKFKMSKQDIVTALTGQNIPIKKISIENYKLFFSDWRQDRNFQEKKLEINNISSNECLSKYIIYCPPTRIVNYKIKYKLTVEIDQNVEKICGLLVKFIQQNQYQPHDETEFEIKNGKLFTIFTPSYSAVHSPVNLIFMAVCKNGTIGNMPLHLKIIDHYYNHF
jgi:hypothetical protein